MVSGFVTSVQGKEIAGKIVVAKVRNSQRTNDPLCRLFEIISCRECPSQPSSGKIFWKLLTVKQQTGIQDIFVDRAVACRLNVLSEVLFENHMYVKKFPQ